MAGLIGLIEGSAFFMSGRHGLVSKEHGAANGQDPIILIPVVAFMSLVLHSLVIF